MEGIDLAGVVDSDFQGIQINFSLPCPAGFANFRGAGWGGKTCFFAGRGAHPWSKPIWAMPKCRVHEPIWVFPSGPSALGTADPIMYHCNGPVSYPGTTMSMPRPAGSCLWSNVAIATRLSKFSMVVFFSTITVSQWVTDSSRKWVLVAFVWNGMM